MPVDYKKFERIKDIYLPYGFQGIDRDNSFVHEIDEQLRENNQFIYIADLLLFKILFTSSGIYDMMGVEPVNHDPGYFITTIHPDDLHRYSLARSKLVNKAQELYQQKGGFSLLSANFMARNRYGSYINLLFQAYSFFSKIPYETVFLLMVMSDISKYDKEIKGFHYYLGDDLSNFRYPDEKLLSLGNIYSKSEYEILRLIEDGLTSQQIAQKLNRSVNTINTHRYNIIAKSGKSHTSEVILDLKKQGLL